MAYDDIIIGSGLSGLAVAMGLNPKRRVLVLSEPEPLRVRYYDATTNVPSGAHGPGGLGNFWHGVIPFANKSDIAPNCQQDFEALFAHFYPSVDIAQRYDSRWLFVPRRPIRPQNWWPRLKANRNGRLQLRALTANHIAENDEGATVYSGSEQFLAERVWICAGALDTPALLARSYGFPLGFKGSASDHAICYLGQIEQSGAGKKSATCVKVERVPQGYWFSALEASTSTALITAKPARFLYRRLDFGIEQRAAFGLPASGAIAKILRAGSLGLLSEAVFNKTGLFSRSDVMSLYAQVEVPKAYDLELATGQLTSRLNNIYAATNATRENVQIPGLRPSTRPELFIRGVHLHDTLDLDVLIDHGINTTGARIRVADGSIMSSIGGEHHTFHMMANAYRAAKQA